MSDNFPPVQIGGQYIDYDAFRNDEYISIDFDHKKIHKSQKYTVSYYWASVANNGTALLSGVIPAGMYPHAEFELAVGGNCVFSMIEGGTITGGTAVTAYNRNRNAGTPSMASIAYHSGTLTGGSTIYQGYMPGGEKNFAVGGGAAADSEWVYKAGVTTTWQLVNISGGAIGVSMEATFYDQEPDA
jgi:hypothetical protein